MFAYWACFHRRVTGNRAALTEIWAVTSSTALFEKRMCSYPCSSCWTTLTWLSWLIYQIFPSHVHCPAFFCCRQGYITFCCVFSPSRFTITFLLTTLLSLCCSNLENKFISMEKTAWGPFLVTWLYTLVFGFFWTTPVNPQSVPPTFPSLMDQGERRCSMAALQFPLYV